MNVDAVIATQAGLFRGQKAVDAGLADRVESPNTAIKNIVLSIPPKVKEPMRIESAGSVQRMAASMKMKMET